MASAGGRSPEKQTRPGVFYSPCQRAETKETCANQGNQ